MRFKGKVIQKPYAPGSKSEREAVMIRLPEGDFLLRRLGGNPFRDEILMTLVGKTIYCEGNITDVSLIISSWEEYHE